jgi:polar amino acid transport system permease protein
MTTTEGDAEFEAGLRRQKRNILIQNLAHAPWWLLAVIGFVIWFAVGVADKHPYPVIWDAVSEGIHTTIRVSVTAYMLALLLGLIVALLRRSKNVIVYQLVTMYVEVVRGIPTLVLVYYMALAAIPQLILHGNDVGNWLLDHPITVPLIHYDIWLRGLGSDLATYRTRDFDPSNRAIIALAISYSAFLSEIFRAGINSVEAGQIEAARSLGMTRWQATFWIVLPQAIRVILPPLGNDFIAMLKESSLVSVVGVEDITRRGQTRATATFTFFETYNVVALTYLVLTLTLSMLVKLLEMYLDWGKARTSSEL